MQEFELKNKIKSVYRQNKNTPRVALSLNFSICNDEKSAGIYCLMSRLLMQGTKNRTSEDLANELEENAIELCVDMKQDYLRFRLVCLNEDFNLAAELLSDVVKNPSFEEFDKEKIKMQGEMVAELDSARMKAFDNYYKNLYDGHFYGHTYTKMLEVLDNITKQDVIEAYQAILSQGEKVLSFVGDIEFNQVESVLNAAFDGLQSNSAQKSFQTPVLSEFKKVEIIKEDANQAQIIQGWLMPNFYSADYPALVLMNIILGSAGLSSRLFLELREKKGLAYHVRSTYEMNEKCANLYIYIATEPKNVQICLDGFATEIEKLKNSFVGEEELESAKNNLIGKQQFVTETNAQQANQLAYYGIMNLGFDFQTKIIEKVKGVKVADIQCVAQKHFAQNSIVSVLRPKN